MSVDWTPVIQTGLSIGAPLLLAGTGAFAAWLKGHKQTILAAAVQTGGGIAYTALVASTRNGVLDWKAAQQNAVSAGVEAARAIATPTNLAALRTQVAGALGDRLAADPTVTVGGGSTATAVAAPGQVALAEAGPA